MDPQGGVGSPSLPGMPVPTPSGLFEADGSFFQRFRVPGALAARRAGVEAHIL
jgi:hypothetical protein